MTETKSSPSELLFLAQRFEQGAVFKRYQTTLAERFDIKDGKTALELQREALAFLVLCAAYPDRCVDMFSTVIDEYWHTFMLFSKLYFEFSALLGRNYIHHQPTTDEDNNGGTFEDFAALYREAYGIEPPAVWQIGRTATRCGGNGGYCNSCKGACKGSCKANV